MGRIPPSPLNVGAVIVLFHPEGDLNTRLQRVIDQTSSIVIIANDGLGADRLGPLSFDRIEYLQPTENIGLAAALNWGIESISKKGLDWCLLLDQDTLIDYGFIEGMEGVWKDCPDRKKIAILAPNYRSPTGSKLAYPSHPKWQILVTSVTSGSIISIDFFHQLGGMHEAFFIEGIDIEYSLRVQNAGFLIVASGNALMTHGAGHTEERLFFGRTILISHHDAWRRYMQLRNLTWIIWKYGSRQPCWAAGAIYSTFKQCVAILFFEENRLLKLWAIFSGVFAGSSDYLFKDSNHTNVERNK